MRLSRLLLPVLIVLALAGCGVLPGIETAGPEPRVKPDAPRPASDLESLLQFYRYIKGLPVAELGKEHDNVRQAYARTRSELNRVRLAMVLSQPNTPFNDGPRALELLEPIAKNQLAPLQGLAFLLSGYIQEENRLQGNVKDLQHKLDALKSLERSLSERDQGNARKR
jgi:hypothetical protein